MLLPSGPRLNAVTFVEDSIAVAIGDSGRVVRSTDNGVTWNDENRPSLESLHSIASSQALVVAVGDGNTILRSTDKGISWNSSTLAMGGFSVVAFFDSGHGIIANEMYGTSNGAESWQKVLDPALPEGDVGGASMLSYSDWIVLCNAGKSGAGTLFRTTDAGNSWQPKVATPYGNSMSAIFVSGPFVCEVGGLANPNRAVILSSIDTGASWERTQQLPGPTLIAVAGRNPSNLISSGDSGIILTTIDSGVSWNRVTSGTIEQLRSVCENDKGNSIAVGGDTHGVVVMGDVPLSSVVSTQNFNQVVINSIYPDPAGQFITLDVDVSEESNVRITVISYSGVVLKSLFDGRLSAGHHELKFDVSRLPAGSYCIGVSSNVQSDVLRFEKIE